MRREAQEGKLMVMRYGSERRFARGTIEWLNDDQTRALVTTESSASRWWRRRFVTAEVERTKPVDRDGITMFASYADWRFVVGGDRVCDHDDDLAQWIEAWWDDERYRRAADAKRAKLKNPWSEVGDLPPARTVRR